MSLASSESEGDYEIIEEGPVSTVSRTWTTLDGGEPQWLAVKTSMIRHKFSKEPHDIVKELRILSSLSHPNIIPVIDHFCDTELSTLNIWMPYIPISLCQLLASPSFSPLPLVAGEPAEESNRLQTRFDTLTKSIMLQTLSGVAYLHNDINGVAHRDIKPNNILLTLDGHVQLIDFGIVWRDGEHEAAKRNDLWPEDSNKMYFEVSTGPYRAPELLFGTRSYDAFAIDLWSLAATFAEFFTALKLCSEEHEDEISDDGSDHGSLSHDQRLKPFVIPNKLRMGMPETRWSRTTLFNSGRGEIGLAWSIFKIRGTPTAENWPEFSNLPDAKGVIFNNTPTVPLAPLLPHLPPSSISVYPHYGKEDDHFPSETMFPSALDLLSRFLVYPSSRRLKAAQALSHPWFVGEILLPADYSLGEKCSGKAIFKFEGKSLGQWLQIILS